MIRTGKIYRAISGHVVWAVAPIILCAAGCGSTMHGAGSTARSQGAGRVASVREADGSHEARGDEDDDDGPSGYVGSSANDDDADFDNDRHTQARYYDGDDGQLRGFGHAPTATEKTVLLALVSRYLAIVATHDGSGACSMLSAAVAAAVPKMYGRGSAGPAYLRTAATCSGVLTLLFEHAQARLTPLPRIVGVRVDGGRALALLGSPNSPAASLPLRYQAGQWRIESLLATPLP